MEEIHKHIVPDSIDQVRLSKYNPSMFDGISSRAGFKKAIKRGEIKVDGVTGTTGTLLSIGMVITRTPSVNVAIRPYPLKIDVVFEDDFLAIVHKPAGIVVSGNRYDTIENALSGILQPSGQPDALARFRAAHRLDKDTSGLLLIAKTSNVRLKLGEVLERREIEKFYLAIVLGKTAENGVITTSVGGKTAETRYRRIDLRPSLVSGWLSLLELNAITGRNHQLRIHLSQQGFPILGDKLYGDPNFLLRGKGLFLTAQKISFQHPTTEQLLNIVLPIPRKFTRFLDGEEQRFRKYTL